MANIVRKPNGTYLVRISAGKDDRGKPVTVSRTFAPERNEPFYVRCFGVAEIDACSFAFSSLRIRFAISSIFSVIQI